VEVVVPISLGKGFQFVDVELLTLQYVQQLEPLLCLCDLQFIAGLLQLLPVQLFPLRARQSGYDPIEAKSQT
jgi:hypothetical protein